MTRHPPSVSRRATAGVPSPYTITVPAAFVDAVRRSGNRVAVACDDERFTYDALHALAGSIAGAVLERLGDGSEPIVVLMDRSTLHAAAMLGVLGAGKFYVLLDPADPLERNAFVVADSTARLVLTTRRRLDVARALVRTGGPSVVAVEDLAATPAVALDARAAADDPCCLVYTSGSTGAPKGVVHTHARVLEPVQAYAGAVGIGPGDRVTQLITMSGSTTNLVSALMRGATLMPFDVRTRGTDALAGWLARERITVYHSVASVFRRVTQSMRAGERLEHLRLVRLSGEVLTRADLELVRAHAHPEAALWLSYASTEVVSIATLHVRAGDVMAHAILPGGFPVDGVDVRVLDDAGRPAAPGDVGEIHVAGRLVFGGYWRRPDLDAGALSIDPADGTRRYRTGDRGSLDADGCLHLAGRGDAQVKVRGIRVEPAETEQALREIPGVADAVVLPHELRPGDMRLVAFVAGGDALPDRGSLRARLRARLPEPFVPVRFFAVDELPLLPGGKVDRRALAESVVLRAAEPRVFVAPRDPVEETLVELWQQALDVDGVGIRDDFFLDLAGDSLSAVRLLTNVGELFGRALPVSVLLEASTVESMAARLQQDGWQPPDDGRLVLHETGACPPLFAVCGVQGHALRLLLIAQGLGADQPFHGLQPPGMDWERAGCRTIEAMAGYYLTIVRAVQPRGPYHLLGTSVGGVLVFEMALALERAGERVATLAMVDTLPPACVTPDGVAHRRPLPPRTPPAGDGPLFEMGERVAHAHRAAIERYELRRRFGGRLTYFLCTGTVPETPDPRALWTAFAAGGVETIPVPGHHGHFHREPQLSAVTAGLRRALAASR